SNAFGLFSSYWQDYADLLRHQNELVAASKLPDPARWHPLRKAANRLAALPPSELTRGAQFSEGAFEEMHPMQARLRCAIVALAAEQFRLERAGWPSAFHHIATPAFL